MESWALFTGDGGELTRGWQGTESQARALAQRTADRIGRPVELVSEGSLPEDAEYDGELFEPRL